MAQLQARILKDIFRILSSASWLYSRKAGQVVPGGALMGFYLNNKVLIQWLLFKIVNDATIPL